jgi:hypothetical protein
VQLTFKLGISKIHVGCVIVVLMCLFLFVCSLCRRCFYKDVHKIHSFASGYVFDFIS